MVDDLMNEVEGANDANADAQPVVEDQLEGQGEVDNQGADVADNLLDEAEGLNPADEGQDAGNEGIADDQVEGLLDNEGDAVGDVADDVLAADAQDQVEGADVLLDELEGQNPAGEGQV
ncbi:MAG: hypothetical protein HRT47_10000 [Candidatus Caenarcaniphilales bacterium]|nr:hypothetical protein [Candidatus Caenarcaniphilales bacterium]